MAYAGRSNLEGGDKILLPPSAFDTLARLNVDYPMLFQLENAAKQTVTHCGVLEFTAEEGSCFVPFWMMQNLLLEEGSILSVKNVSLPKATFVKLQPQHVDFLEISNPRAVLEHALRNFSCVTKGDVICVPYNNKNYHFMLQEVKPQDAACIIETDCNVDFDAPVGYVDPSTVSEKCNSGAPSVATSDISVVSGNSSVNNPVINSEEEDLSNRTRIVNGQIVRPENTSMSSSSTNNKLDNSMVAKQVGTTGVQANAAVVSLQGKATVDYWAVAAGDGARLDGKKPAVLKDEAGNEVDVRDLRAKAAAARLAAMNKVASKTANTTISETTVAASSHGTDGSKSQTMQRKSLIDRKKYSKRKQNTIAFKGNANKF